MDTRILDTTDPLTGLSRLFHYDHESESFTIETVQDVSAIIEQNKARFNDARGGGEMRHVASIPMSILAELQRNGIAKDPARMKAWLNDPDNRLFRTHPGKV